MAKNPPDRGQTMPITFMRRWSPFLVIRVLFPLRSQRRLGLGFSFKSGFIGKPDIDVRVLKEFGYLFSKSFPLSFILTVRPGLRRFQGEAAFMEKPNDRLITALDLVAFADMPVKGFGGPKRALGFFRLFEKLDQLLGLLPPQEWRSVRGVS